MGLGPSRAYKNLHACPENFISIRPGNEEVPAVASRGVLVGMVEMRDPVTPSGAAAKQGAVEGLLTLASLP